VWVHARLCKLQKGCTQLAAASDKAYQLLAQGRWFSPGTPASSTTKTGRHDIAEILLKVALNTINQSIKNTTNTIACQRNKIVNTTIRKTSYVTQPCFKLLKITKTLNQDTFGNSLLQTKMCSPYYHAKYTSNNTA